MQELIERLWYGLAGLIVATFGAIILFSSVKEVSGLDGPRWVMFLIGSAMLTCAWAALRSQSSQGGE